MTNITYQKLQSYFDDLQKDCLKLQNYTIKLKNQDKTNRHKMYQLVHKDNGNVMFLARTANDFMECLYALEMGFFLK